MAEHRYFTLDEANELVPQLAHLMGQQMKLLGEIESLVRSLSAELGPLDEARVKPDDADSPGIRERKNTLARAVQTYRDRWTRVEETGAIMKDPRLGLVDFYATIEGETVLLCWQYGEDEVAFWHPVDEGFASRRPLHDLANAPVLN
jgi:hypothetical protein